MISQYLQLYIYSIFDPTCCCSFYYRNGREYLNSLDNTEHNIPQPIYLGAEVIMKYILMLVN